MIQSTMLQTKFEMLSIFVSNAFQPYKVMIRSLDADNFPSPKTTSEDGEEDETGFDDDDVVDDYLFQCLSGTRGDDDDNDDNKQ
jgi:hypothetical protein